MTCADVLDLEPGPDAVAQALDWLEQLAEREHWTPRQRQALALSLDEAVTNVVMHGLPARDMARLRVRHLPGPTHVAIRLEDSGPPFDPTQVPPPPPILDLDSLAIGGRGILLMRNMLSSLDYARTDDGWNQLTLRMDRQAPAATPG